MTLPMFKVEQMNGDKQQEPEQPETIKEWLSARVKERGESMRAASLGADLDHGAISRFRRGVTPSPSSCKKLAQYFGASEAEQRAMEDELLVMAGHKSPEDKPLEDTDVPPELMALVDDLREKVPDRSKRRKVVEELRRLVDLIS